MRGDKEDSKDPMGVDTLHGGWLDGSTDDDGVAGTRSLTDLEARRFADLSVVHGLLCLAAGAASAEERINRVMSSLGSDARSPAVIRMGGGTWRRWTPRLAVAAGVALAVVLLAPFDWGGAPQAALAEVIAAAELPVDRCYDVAIERAAGNGPRATGTLDVRGNAFVLSLTGPEGRQLVFGSNDDRSWMVPPRGPVLVRGPGHRPPFLAEQGVEGELLEVPRVLHLFRRGYRLSLVEDQPGRRTLRAERRAARRGPGPDLAIVTADTETRHVQEMTLEWTDAPGPRGMRRMTLTAADCEARPENWYQHEAHHGPDRIIRSAD